MRAPAESCRSSNRKVRVNTSLSFRRWPKANAPEQILAEAENSAAGLIVLMILNKGLLERALLGSTAERVVRVSQVPVLSFPVQIKADRDREHGTPSRVPCRILPRCREQKGMEICQSRNTNRIWPTGVEWFSQERSITRKRSVRYNSRGVAESVTTP